MERSREMILKSITELLAFVNLVARQDQIALLSVKSAGVNDSQKSSGDDGLISNSQVTQITDAVIRLHKVANHLGERAKLESLVSRVIETAVKAWLESNLDGMVNEVVQQHARHRQEVR